MIVTDPIADMLTRIRNGIIAKHETVEVPMSSMKKASFYDDIKGIIAIQGARLGVSAEDIYTDTEIGKSTFFQRKKSPESFRLDELKKVMDYLDVDIKLVPRH